jgi:hypothetical protein
VLGKQGSDDQVLTQLCTYVQTVCKTCNL